MLPNYPDDDDIKRLVTEFFQEEKQKAINNQIVEQSNFLWKAKTILKYLFSGDKEFDGDIKSVLRRILDD